MSTRIRRATRHLLSVSSFGLGSVLVWRAVTTSPILAVASALGLAIALWWLKRRERSQLGQRLTGVAAQDLLLGATLLAGLWLALFAVFSLGDVGATTARATSIPIGHDAAPMTMGQVLWIALAGTLGVTGLLVPFRRAPSKRRDLRETSLAGLRGQPRAVGMTPRSSEAVDRTD